MSAVDTFNGDQDSTIHGDILVMAAEIPPFGDGGILPDENGSSSETDG